ncbi:hypothetical protein A0Z00_08650 [Campylobacter upsaliensis]|nr:hypothetical protein [Campylobacter upsaliensis]
MKREQGKKASQKRLNLTPFVWGGGGRSSRVKQGQAGSSRVKQGQAGSSRVKQGQAGSSKVKQGQARSSKVKQGQARSSVWRRQTRLKRHGKFTPNGKANSRQIQAKFSQAKKAFFKS